MTLHLRPYPSLVAGLVLLAACGPSNPEQEDGTGTTEATSPGTDPTEVVPTGADTTDSTPTGGSSAECGGCGTILDGDTAPSGVPQIDGFIIAVDRLRSAVSVAEYAFRTDIIALADLYGLVPDEVDADYVASLVAAIKADVAAHTKGVQPLHIAGRCGSDIDVATDALRRCETAAACDVTVAQARPPVLCDGTCVGTCTGLCQGPLSCAVVAADLPCEGACAGTCTFVAPAACSGACHGTCTGSCSLFANNGDCAGRCDGNCTGACDLPEPAACAGQCHGSCLLEQGQAQCDVTGQCRGACDGECAGECLGEVTPPGSPGCAATSTCQPQAAAQGSVSLGCSPPSLDLQYTFIDGLDAAARGAFVARTRELELRATAILQGTSLLGVLITGENNGAVMFDPPPLATMTVAIQGLVAGLGGLPVPASRLACVESALGAAIMVLADTGTRVAPTLQAQAVFAAFVTTGS